MGAVDEPAGHENGERHAVPREDRLGMVEIVAIPVVEGEAGEGRCTLVGKRRRQIVERNEAIAVPLQPGDGPIEKLRGDFEMGVRIEGPGNPRADVMQGENSAAPDGHQASGQRGLDRAPTQAHRRLPRAAPSS